MSNLTILPLLIPLTTGALLIFFRHQRVWLRAISLLSALLNIGVSLYLASQVYERGVLTLNMGGWAPPYGIVFVADMFASILVVTTAVIGALCLIYAFVTVEEDKERHYFYVFYQFLLVGVIGSFLTGDIFNLFVCFEVMLISSYALIVLGGKKRQLRESIKYLLINIISSAMFVTSVAYLYGVTGTLNLAHLSLRVAEAGQGGMMTLLAILFLFVFGMKAGLLLFFWLPGSYTVPSPVVTALFGALLTKVGIYAIIRIFTLVFYHDPGVTHTFIGVLAALTMILGVIGALAYQDVNRVLVYNIVAGVGFIVFGLAVANQSSLEGAIYYLMHDMVAKALLFLLGGLIVMAAGTDKLTRMGGMIKTYPIVGWLFLLTTMSLVGVPPLSGFIGKLLIVKGGLEAGWYWTTAISLIMSLLVLLSLIRVFMMAFWSEGSLNKIQPEKPFKLNAGHVAPIVGLSLLVVLIGVGAQLLHPYVSTAAELLMKPELYIDAVLKE
ncbi:Na+/H+ antiporter subunit D [Paenibacillus sp. 598K]|uniref:Na+/H+ antiporter subunit D n=1 Tax=Paenibacillus sp. 598K TaxID=1117987 RepID=UPI000FFA2D7F|nr:Na+/H+ antiporter subunit D [Paenibacillus sp. 598K]GBF73888.1 Na+/H+ antiporter subunit D [Paenibacillus sp. 598K]